MQNCVARAKLQQNFSRVTSLLNQSNETCLILIIVDFFKKKLQPLEQNINKELFLTFKCTKTFCADVYKSRMSRLTENMRKQVDAAFYRKLRVSERMVPK